MRDGIFSFKWHFGSALWLWQRSRKSRAKLILKQEPHREKWEKSNFNVKTESTQDEFSYFFFFSSFYFIHLKRAKYMEKKKQLSNRATMWFNQQKMYLHLQTITRFNGVALFKTARPTLNINTHTRTHDTSCTRRHSSERTQDRRRKKMMRTFLPFYHEE